MNARTLALSLAPSLALSLALVFASGCNTFFESSPEFLENADAGLDTQVEDVTEDVVVADVEEDGEVDAPDASDTSSDADASDDAADGDAGDAADGGAGSPWSLTDLASTDVLPKVSITGTTAAGGGPTEFGVAWIEEDDPATEGGNAVLERITLPGLPMAESVPVSLPSDLQRDVATGLDSSGRLAWGAVQPCQSTVVAHTAIQDNASQWELKPISSDGCNVGHELDQIALTGGLNMFVGSGSVTPNWVWTATYSTEPDKIATIKPGFSTADYMEVTPSNISFDRNFIRGSGGRLVLLRMATRDQAIIWDTVAREAQPADPVVIENVEIVNDADLVWLDRNDYLLVNSQNGLIKLATWNCDLSTPDQCQDVDIVQQYDEPDVEALRMAAFNGGIVVGALASNADGHALVFRVIPITPPLTPGAGSYEFGTPITSTIQLDNISTEDFDVAAAFTEGELFVAAAVLREQNGSPGVEVHGYRYPDFWSIDD